MGKNSRRKPRATALAAEKKRFPADDYFRKGPFEMARFGRHIVVRNNMSPDEHRRFMEVEAARLPAVVAAIDGHVRAIVGVVEKFDPLTILQRAYWEEITPMVLQEGDAPETKDSVIAQRMVDYVQGVIAAVPVVAGVERPRISDEGWGELLLNVEGLFNTINRDYVFCRTADWRVNGGAPEERHEFYVRALLMWCNVTGARYHHQEVSHLRELLAPHSAVLQRIWGVDADGVVTGLGRVLHSLSRGLGEALGQMWKSYEEFEALAKNSDAATKDAVLAEKMAAVRADAGMQGIAGKLQGYDLFKVDDYLPTSLLKELSWAPGECRDFIDGQDQSGWPTRVWPRTRRPFLAIGGSYYCFDVHSLFDHIYRVLQRAVLAHEPGYRHGWDDAQKQVSEAMPLRLLQQLCPGARTRSSIFYQTRELDAQGRRKWCELDGVVSYVDHLFIVEVKAGVFTLAPPETGLDVYLRSIEKLIFAPADQGERFLQWLEAEGKIDLFDAQHVKIGELDRRDYAHVTVCAISVDPFTELAAKSHHLRSLVGHQGTVPFWAMSLGDLMTYTELFDNPLTFLHYVEKRGQAICSEKLVLDDEFDHYGMYLKHNNYDLYAARIGTEGRATWNGYRAVVNAYFNGRERGEAVTLPRQDMPPLLKAMVNVLANSRYPERRRAVSLLLDQDGDTRENAARTLAESMASQQQRRRPKPFSLYGDHLNVTYFCWQVGVVTPVPDFASDHTKACMLLAGEAERMLLELSFAADGTLLDVEPTVVKASSIGAAERAKLAGYVQELKEQRMSRVTGIKGKLGRNDMCPCGSGRKYKKCCGF